MLKVFVFVLGMLLVPLPTTHSKETIRIKIQGSSTVNPIVAEAAEIFHKQKGWTILLDTQGGSSGGIAAVGEGLVDIGMTSRELTLEDYQHYPQTNFTAYAIGQDAVALIVSKAVWDQGIHALSKEQVKKIYEKQITHWDALGGSHTPIVFYNKEPGRGTWEVFAKWLYQDAKKAPPVLHPEIGSNEEGRNKVASHPSAMSQLSYAWTENTAKIKALSIQLENGALVVPSKKTIRSGTYPLARKLYVVTNGPAQGPVRDLIEFLLSPSGQTLVQKHGYLPL
jgi:phosphate transport system substrate-binding protein